MHVRNGDETIVEVIRWLVFYSKEFIRIESYNDIAKADISINYSLLDKSKIPNSISLFYHGNFIEEINDDVESKLKFWMLNLYQVVLQNSS